MNCLSEETLSAYLDGQAASVERIQAAMHLAACRRCRNELDLLAGLRARLHQVHEVPPMPEELHRSLEAMVPRAVLDRRIVRPDSFARWAWMSAGLASFACAALALLVWYRGAAAQIEVPADLILAAHERYALTMPLVPRGAMVARLPEEIAEEGVEKP